MLVAAPRSRGASPVNTTRVTPKVPMAPARDATTMGRTGDTTQVTDTRSKVTNASEVSMAPTRDATTLGGTTSVAFAKATNQVAVTTSTRGWSNSPT